MNDAAVTIIRSFIAAVELIRSEVRADTDSECPILDLVRSVKRGEIESSGILRSGTTYKVHGIGCHFSTRSAAEIDVDVLPTGIEKFDAWRIGQFQRSVGAEVCDWSTLEVGCTALVADGVLIDLKDGWYGLPSSD